MVVYGSIPGNFHKIIGFCHFFFGMSIRTGENRQVPTLPLATPRLTLSMSISASKSLSARGDEPCRWKGSILTRRKCKRSPKKSLSPTHGDVFSFFVGQFFPRTWWHINIVFFWSGSVHHYHHCLPTSTRDVTLEPWAPWISKTSTNLARLASRISELLDSSGTLLFWGLWSKELPN